MSNLINNDNDIARSFIKLSTHNFFHSLKLESMLYTHTYTPLNKATLYFTYSLVHDLNIHTYMIHITTLYTIYTYIYIEIYINIYILHLFKLKLCDFFFCLLVRFVIFLLHVNNKNNKDICGVNLPYAYIYITIYIYI